MNANQQKILIVEDSPSQAAVMAALVQQAGYDAVVYNELPTGIVQILNKEQPDMVLLDLKLLDSQGKQVADGFQICREVKRFPKKPPVIVVSADGDDDTCQWALLQGADAFLQKPFKAEDLTKVISDIFSGN